MPALATPRTTTHIEAAYYEKRPDGKAQCHLCPHECLLAEGKKGICNIRRNEGGRLIASGYGECTSLSMDPIEKKPLYHFHPGKSILSTGPNGCNFACKFCQNWTISQEEVDTAYVTPKDLVTLAGKHGSLGISYTYSEPLIWFEYLRDAGTLAHEAGLVNVLVTNGFINPEPLEELLPLIDAMNIDLKASSEDFYRQQCGGRLEPVLETIRAAYNKCHIELTNLVIPTLNDSDEDLDRLIAWVAELGVEIPLHFSRYFPHHKLNLPPTPESTLVRAYEKARKRLRYVYLGNVALEGTSDTHCYQCQALLVVRSGYRTRIVGLSGGKCRSCGARADFVGVP
jgi:pyruvate formate lyase activating enzyme